MSAVHPIALVAFAWTLVAPVQAHAQTAQAPPSHRRAMPPLFDVAVVELPAIDLAAERADPRRSSAGQAIAVPHAVAVDVLTSGSLEMLDDGSRLYRLRVHAPEATDLNFGFTRFDLPPGSTLHIVAEHADYFQGPYGWQDGTDGALWTAMVPGDRAVIEVVLPPTSKHPAVLELGQVAAGFADMFRWQAAPKQGSCNIDVACPMSAGWEDQIQSVGVFTIDGWWVCSGTLVADVPRSMKPWFLTANECGITEENDQTLVVYWNFESPTCGLLDGGPLSDNQSGSKLKASKIDVNFALVELTQTPDPASNLYLSGWDQTGRVPWGSVAIHHPSTDEKAISFNYDQLTTVDSCTTLGVETHWEVGNWEDGSVEPGSLGGGLWDLNSQLLVGVLSGGPSSCSVSGASCFGKFSEAWDKAENAPNRLRDWLDPDNVGLSTIEGFYHVAPPTIELVSHASIDTCAEDPSLDNGVLEPGELLDITVTITSETAWTGITGVLQSDTPGVVMLTDTASWPDLTAGGTATSTTFRAEVQNTLPCAAAAAFDLSVSTAEGSSFPLTFREPVGLVGSPAELPLQLVDDGITVNTIEVIDDTVLTDLNVRLRMTHSYIGDLTITLQSPSGTQVKLVDRPDHPAQSFGCSDNDLDVTFDDDATVVLEDHCPGTEPWYHGDGIPLESLSAFNGENSVGTWTLFIEDHQAQDSGYLLEFMLDATPEWVGQCAYCVPIGPVSLTMTGTCPGDISVLGEGFTPYGKLMVFRGDAIGSSVNEDDPCSGDPLDLENAALFKNLYADPYGTFSAGGHVDETLCGTSAYQVIDGATCRITGTISI